MHDFKVGDLVAVKKDKKLSPVLNSPSCSTLRFYHGKQGMIIKKESEGYTMTTLFVEWRVLFPNQKSVIFKDCELILLSNANKS